MKIVVTDHAFPDLATEEAVATAAGAPATAAAVATSEAPAAAKAMRRPIQTAQVTVAGCPAAPEDDTWGGGGGGWKPGALQASERLRRPPGTSCRKRVQDGHAEGKALDGFRTASRQSHP